MIMSIQEAMDFLQETCHEEAKRWWTDIHTGASIKERPHVVGEKLMLIVSEIAEAMEGHRRNAMDDKLPQFTSMEVELADALIRIYDLAGAYNLRVGEAAAHKMRYNRQREDHKIENRLAEGGKAY